MSTRAGRGCKVAGRFPSGLTFLCGFLMILSARGWPLLQVLEPRFWPGTGFDCRRTNEAIGRYSIAVNELQPHFGFVRAQFSAWFKRRSQLRGGWGRRPKGDAPRSEAGALG